MQTPRIEFKSGTGLPCFAMPAPRRDRGWEIYVTDNGLELFSRFATDAEIQALTGAQL